MNTTTIGGATIGWTDTGDGDVTLLLHAGVFEAWFKPLAELLDGRVIRMTRAGYAGGPVPSGLIEVADHAAHAAALLEQLGAAPATVVGHSSSSAIALQLAHDHPELVSRLVLCEPPLIDTLVDPADLAEVHAAIGPAIGKAMHAMGNGDLPVAFDAFMSAVGGPGYRAVLADALGQDGLARAERDAGFFFANEIPALNGWTPGDLSSITAPVLFVQGGRESTSDTPVDRAPGGRRAQRPHRDARPRRPPASAHPRRRAEEPPRLVEHQRGAKSGLSTSTTGQDHASPVGVHPAPGAHHVLDRHVLPRQAGGHGRTARLAKVTAIFCKAGRSRITGRSSCSDE